ncbi:Hint domain-containing protein [Tropicimonas sediminicola]|uniref:Hint domain-containing protein n=1 Tax=Tropicimonas sediminicola TaxID=1031541 RepID=A0A239HKH7_9RHOB|nr:Hint domain-containing protein [Tropicimonas sediminicola]SNS81333.1 Hint domain-containing protein [Tropicimonas sediminicola]
MTPSLDPDYACHVLPGAAFRVIAGANLGDPLLGTEELCPGDVYRLDTDAQALQLAISDRQSAGGRVLSPDTEGQRVASGTEVARPGAALRLAARLTFLGREGHKVDLLLIELTDGDGTERVALPLDPVEPGQGHTLIGVDTAPAPVRLADITAVAFGQGTRITLADGRQAAVETLRPGDRLLTRDHGPQPLRSVLRRTVRTVGPHAPVVIPAGTLGNAGDLILGQQQRIFVYQRGDDRLTETAEMLVKAHYLVDDERIFLRPGGYGDFFALVLDRHEVIYAECIPVESLEISHRTLAALPEDIAREVGDELPGLDHRPHVGTEADRRAAELARERLLRERQNRR